MLGDRDWTTDLPTWPFPNTTIEFGEATDGTEATRWRPRTEVVIAAAVAMGLALGGLAWALWRGRDRDRVSRSPAPAIAHMPAPVPAPAPAPAPEPLWMPTRAEIDRMVQGIRGYTRLAPHTDDDALAQMVWAAYWQHVPFPRLGSVASPGVGEALDLVFGVIAAARAELSRTVASEPMTRDEPTERPDTTAAPVRDSPTPGSLYRVRPGDTLLGDAGIAARAVCAAVLDAARRRGQAIGKARGRAHRFASEARAQATYADLIQRGMWNTQHGPQLVEGALLWLPPLDRVRLLDRSRTRRVSLDPHPWPDGSSKLEPPMLRNSKCSLAWPASSSLRSIRILA
jgi:hypothetical protein